LIYEQMKQFAGSNRILGLHRLRQKDSANRAKATGMDYQISRNLTDPGSQYRRRTIPTLRELT
jgi:hypothetical protein